MVGPGQDHLDTSSLVYLAADPGHQLGPYLGYRHIWVAWWRLSELEPERLKTQGQEPPDFCRTVAAQSENSFQGKEWAQH